MPASTCWLVALLLAPPRQEAELDGLWIGGLAGPRGELELELRFAGGGAGASAAVHVPAEDLRASAPVTVDDEGRLALVFATLDHGSIALALDLEAGTLAGPAAVDGEPAGGARLVRVREASPEELAGLAGAFVEPDGNELLLVPGAEGALHLLDLDGPALRAERYVRVGERWLELLAGGALGRELSLARGPDGASLRWRTASGEERGARALSPQPFRIEERRFPAGDGATLAGLALLPAGTGPCAGVAYVHGSGPANTRTDHWDLAVCAHLARHGIAALIPDKRGSGRSEGDWRQADYARLADDALAAVELLRGQPGVAPDRVGVVGLSQGGTLSPLAGVRGGERVAFVVSLSGSGVDLRASTTFEVESLARGAGCDEAELEHVRALQDAAVEWVLGDGTWEDFAALRADALAGSPRLRAVAQGFPPDAGHWKWAFHRRVGAFDPLPSWEALRQPALVVLGAEDELVPVAASAARLAPLFRDPPRRTLRVFEGSGHGLGDPATGWIRAEVLALLVEWIRGVTDG